MYLQPESFPFPLLRAEKCWDPQRFEKTMLTCFGATGLHLLSSSDFLPFALAALIREKRNAVRSHLLCFPRHWLTAEQWGRLCSSQLAPELEKRMVGRRKELITHKRVCTDTRTADHKKGPLGECTEELCCSSIWYQNSTCKTGEF